MKVQYIVLITFGVIFALMLGSFLFGISFGFLPKENIILEIDRIYHHRPLTFLVAIFLYGMSYVVTKTLIKRLTKEEVFIAENNHGRVAISISAVETVVHKVLKNYNEIGKYKLRCFAQGRKLAVRVLIREWTGSQVHEATERLSTHLKSRLDSMMGLRDNFEVLIRIDKLREPSGAV